MNVLITGSTGFLGSKVLEELLTQPLVDTIIGTGRSFKKENPSIKNTKVTYLLGDLTNLEFVKSLFKSKIDIVVNCASLSSPWGSYDDFYQANCVTQNHLIQCAQSNGVKRFIYISSPSIYFRFEGQFNITETTPLPQALVNNYALTKVEAERVLKDSGLSYVILRPRALIGAGDTVIMPRLIRSYKEGRLKIMGSGENTVDLTCVKNMVSAIWLAIIADEQNCNTDYNITNDAPVKLWTSINYMFKELGFEPIVKKLPYRFLYFVAALMEINGRYFSKKEPVLTKYSVGVMAKSISFDISKAKKQLGYKPLQTTEEGMIEFVNWYKTQNL